MIKKILIVLVVFAASMGFLLYLGLADNDARPAIGERKMASSGGVDIYYYLSGPEHKVPVVLLPSYARSASDFNELVNVLNKAGFRTLAMQPRGIDGSELPSIDVTFHTYAADLVTVLDEENIIDSVSIIGHAYGNRIARTFASDYPKRSHRLILLAAGGEVPTPADVSSAIMTAMFGILPESTRREAIGFAFFANADEIPDYWITGWYPMAGLAQGQATAASTTESTDPEWGSGGDDQIIVLQPTEDAAAAHGAASLKERFPERVSVHLIEQAGHAILPEQPVQIAAIITAVLGGEQN